MSEFYNETTKEYEFDEEERVYAIDVDEILDEFEETLGSKESRDLWQKKSQEEQEKELAKFHLGVRKIRKLLEQEY